MPPLVPWLRAALVGPSLAVTFLVTALTLAGPVGEGQSRWSLWLVSMAYGGVLAVLCGGSLVAVDWTLFTAEKKKLPTGRRAWLTSLAMPVLLMIIYQMLSPSEDFGPAWYAATIIPAVVLAGALRWMLSEDFRPTSSPA
jgi:hypothetical protein